MDRMAIATAIPFMAKDFGLSPLGMGGVMSAFFIGYALMQLPGGILADRFAAWGLMNWLPTYLLQARGFSLPKLGLLGSLPYLAGALGYFLGGYFSDGYFRQRRHIPIATGLLGGGFMTYLATAAPSGEWAVLALVLAFLCVFIAAGGIFTLPLVTVPPHAVGAAFGFVNTAAQFAAFLSPLAVGYVLSVTHNDFNTALYGFVGFFIAAAMAALKIRSPDASLELSTS